MIFALLFLVINLTFAAAEDRLHVATNEDTNTLMVHGNAFAVQSSWTGPRGGNGLAAPNMLMAMWDRSLSEHQILTTNLMLTTEKWTYPASGYPELLQIGEEHSDGTPFIDYQHPHSSPIMEISVADTIALGEGLHLKLSFAPRGPSSDGPESFMHRVTGMDVNPDAPLGHHIGQDVGHISSTVATASLSYYENRLEVSGFHGAEPQPTKVDLPMGAIDSFAARWTTEFAPHWKGMLSWAYARNSHQHDMSEDLLSTRRTSASLYWDHEFGEWHLYDTFIFGQLDTDEMATEKSFLDEFVLQHAHHSFWGRFEALQRLPMDLELSSSVPNQMRTRWIRALTLGFTQRILDLSDAELRVGVSGTVDFVPKDFEGDYGAFPMTGRVFLQLTGMKMWQL